MVPENETVTIRKSEYRRMNSGIARLQTACTKKHKAMVELEGKLTEYSEVRTSNRDIQEKDRLIESLQVVNRNSQMTILDQQNKVANLQKELRSTRPKFGLSSLFSSQGRVGSTEAAYKSRIQELQQSIKAQEADMQRKEHGFAAARDEFTREMQEVRTLSSRNTFKVADNEVVERWEELAFKIRQFVDWHIYAYPLDDLSKEAIHAYADLCVNPTVFLTHPLLVPFLFEAVIWSSLVQSIFSTGLASLAKTTLKPAGTFEVI